MKGKKEDLNGFLKSLSYGMTYKILEEGKDTAELKAIGKKHNLKLPAKDLSVFKGIYAFVDQENKNGCTLPKEEVEKSLDTLTGKSVDFDHIRKRIVGYWLEGAIEKDQLVAYGVFFKGSLEEEYQEIKDLFNNGNLKISFEAWGNREYKDENNESYDLLDIEFAGGALLIDTKPAFAGAKVLELAKVMTAPDSFVKEEEVKNLTDNQKKYMELSQFYVSDMNTLLRLLSEVECPGCGEQYTQDIQSIDFTEGTMQTKCYMCDSQNKVSMMPKAKKMSKANEDKITITKIKSDIPNKLEESKNMEEKIKELESAVANLTAKVSALEAEKASLTEKLTASEAKVASVEAEKASAIETAKKDATTIANRRAELGEEFSKDLKDEDILDEVKFENAKLKKENSELKKGNETKGKKEEKKEVKETTENASLETGTKDKKENEITVKASNVRRYAFGE